MGELIKHARRELEIAGLFDKDSDYGGALATNALEIVETFANQGHSGFSASMMANLLNKLLRYEPLGPLTGEDSEWNLTTHSEPGLLQNNRCSTVFKEADGGAYDINGKVFREPDGFTFTSADSRVSVVFPYTPNIEYVDVPK